MSDKKQFTWEGQGTVKRIDPYTSKKGASMPTLVIETAGQYPQLIPCKAFRDMVEEVEALKPGQEVIVRCHVGGREYNGRVYGDNVLESIALLGGKMKQPEPPQADEDELPPF